MKRDINLIRKILLCSMEHQSLDTIRNDYDMHTIQYHIVLCRDAGFLNPDSHLSQEGIKFVHRYGNDTVWNKIMETFQRNTLLSPSYELINDVYDAMLRRGELNGL